MTKEQFIAKWGKPDFGEYWLQTPEATFWAASYKMPPETLVEMSKDLLQLDIADGSAKRLATFCSIYYNAVSVVRLKDN